MELFCGSQMFEMFITQRKQNQFQQGNFEKRVSRISEANCRLTELEDKEKTSKGKSMFGAFKKKFINTKQTQFNQEISGPTNFTTVSQTTPVPQVIPKSPSASLEAEVLQPQNSAEIQNLTPTHRRKRSKVTTNATT